MGVRLLISNRDTGQTVMYDSVSMTAFGPVFDTEEHATHFLAWTASVKGIVDLRGIHHLSYAGGLTQLHADWAAICLDEDGQLTEEAEQLLEG